jgi:hypothetical protein
VDRNSSLRPPPGCVPKCVAHSGSVFIERLPLGRAHATNEDRAASYLLRSRHDPRLTRRSLDGLKGGETGNRPETGRADQSSPKVEHENTPPVHGIDRLRRPVFALARSSSCRELMRCAHITLRGPGRGRRRVLRRLRSVISGRNTIPS